MAWKPEHPLTVWLKRQKPKMSLHAFSQVKSIPFRSLYRHTNGESENPSRDVMKAIEAGTGGAVTVLKQSLWLERRKQVADA